MGEPIVCHTPHNEPPPHIHPHICTIQIQISSSSSGRQIRTAGAYPRAIIYIHIHRHIAHMADGDTRGADSFNSFVMELFVMAHSYAMPCVTRIWGPYTWARSKSYMGTRPRNRARGEPERTQRKREQVGRESREGEQDLLAHLALIHVAG